MKDKPYRKNVGMVVFNSKGYVLVGERINYPGSWQFPQGGIDESEEPAEAAKRELYEEVGINDGIIIYQMPEWVNYDFPTELNIKHLKKYRGQTQKWFLIYWDRPIEDCNLDVHEKEFSRLNFIPLDSAMDTVVPFKKDVYEKVITEFRPKIQEFIIKK